MSLLYLVSVECSFLIRSRLHEGMVITIEPGKLPTEDTALFELTRSGIYVPPSPHFPKEFHNIGIRIEVR